LSTHPVALGQGTTNENESGSGALLRELVMTTYWLALQSSVNREFGVCTSVFLLSAH